MLSEGILLLAEVEPLPVWRIVMGMAGGLALFLIGMDMMTDALKVAAGDRLRDLLGRLTSNRFFAVISGTVVTGIIQSSSVTTVLLVGFLAAGLMTLPQAIGVILGANIGSTVMAQIIAFRITEAALWMVAFGYALSWVRKWPGVGQGGRALAGIGIIFLGMQIMGVGMEPLRSYPPFIEFMAELRNPWLAVAVGAIFTALIQSSAVTTGIVIVMAGQGLIPLPVGIAVALGANIGTCVTAMLAAIGKPVEAVRAAVAHTLFNIIGAVAWIFFIDQLTAIAIWISPSSPESLAAIERLAADTPRQVANAHTIFNVINTLIALPFLGLFASFLYWLIPDRPRIEPEVIKPRFISHDLIETPALALPAARKETVRLGSLSLRLTHRMMPDILIGDQQALNRVEAGDHDIDLLHAPLVDYLARIGTHQMTDQQTDHAQRLLEVANALESIGDIIETSLVSLARTRLRRHVIVSPETREVIEQVHREVVHALAMAVRAVRDEDIELARKVVNRKAPLNDLIDEAGRHQQRRLLADAPNRLAAYSFEMDVIENLKRIYYFSKRVARSVLPDEAERRAATEG